MSVRRRFAPSLLALALGASTAGLVACGSDSAKLPGNEADALLTRLDQARSALDGGECTKAAQAAASLRQDVLALPSTVDRRLRQRLRQGADKLIENMPEDCAARQRELEEKTQTTDTLPETTTTETTPTVTEPTTTETTPTVTTPTTTEPTITTDPPTTEPPPDGTGGVSPDEEDPGA